MANNKEIGDIIKSWIKNINSYKNYQLGISKSKIVPFHFPQKKNSSEQGLYDILTYIH